MNKIITTTTDHLEGWEVIQYLPPISANVVIGANVLSDIAASWTDFFGGRSSSYERRLQEVYLQATESLKRKAKALGANCIVGIRIDTGEVSGKGTQMFMVSAVGTPVIARSIRSAPVKSISEGQSDVVDGALVDKIIRANGIIEQFEKDPSVQIGPSTLDFIVDSKMSMLSDIMLKLLRRVGTDPEAEEKVKRISGYFNRLDPEVASEIVYNYLLVNEVAPVFRNRLIKLLVSNNLVRYDKIKDLLESGDTNTQKIALELLVVSKETYTRDDVLRLNEITGLIEARFPPTHTREEVKGVFSKNAKEVWICNCGNRNRAEVDYCTSCNNDKFGFSVSESKPPSVLNLLSARLKVIEKLLMN